MRARVPGLALPILLLLVAAFAPMSPPAPLPDVYTVSVGPVNLAGRVLDLKFGPADPQIVHAGTASGGLWRSPDGGATWTPLTDGLPSLAVGAVALPSPGVIVIGTGEGTLNFDRVGGVGILRSTDGGATWQTTGFSRDECSGHGFHVMEVGPSGTLLAGATDGLWRSDDLGVTWTAVRSSGDWYDVLWKPGDPAGVYACRGSAPSGNGVFASTDDGITWARVGTGQPLSLLIGKTKLAASAAAPSTLYALFAEPASPGGTVGVYRSTDDGATWSAQNTIVNIAGGQGWYNLSLVADPDDADRLLAGGVSLFRSSDAGVNWTPTGSGTVHVDHHDAVYRPGGDDDVFVATDGGIWESTDDGLTWTGHNDGLVDTQFRDLAVSDHPADPDFLVGCVRDQGVLCRDGGDEWYGAYGDAGTCKIDPNDGTTVYLMLPNGLARSTNRCAGPWTLLASGITGVPAFPPPLDEDRTPGRGGHLYTSTSDGIFRTTNGGSSWTHVDSRPATWISISPLGGDVVWTVRASGVTRTTDDGASWRDASPYGFTTGGARRIVAHPTDANAAVVVFSGCAPGLAHVASTTDLGATWSDATGDLPSHPVNALAIDPVMPTVWYAGSDRGLWSTMDGGSHWHFWQSFPYVVVRDLEIQTTLRRLFVATYGRGVWEIGLEPVVPGAPVPDVTSESGLHLALPYPNPVSEEIVLRYAARASGTVSVRIYDVRGRLVTELVREGPGDGVVRSVAWRAEGIPTGIYFAVLQAGSERVSRKLALRE